MFYCPVPHAEICIAHAIDLYPGKSRRHREQCDRLKPVKPRSAEKRAADGAGDKDAVFTARQELSSCIL